MSGSRLLALLGALLLAPALVRAADRDAGEAQTPAKPPFRFMVDADVCPVPETGPFEPDGFGDFQRAVRDALLPDDGAGTVLQVIVQPSFDPPYSIALVRPRAEEATDENLRLRLIVAKANLWSEMMRQMERQQGTVMHLDPKHQRSALAKVSRTTAAKTVAASAVLAGQLRDVWNGVLARTQYVHEVLVGPDGRRLIRHRGDGTDYSFWSEGRSGTTHSPRTGSLLSDFVGVFEGLHQYIDLEPSKRAGQERTLKDALVRLKLRLEANEPCVRPER